MPFFNWVRWLRSLRRPRGNTYRRDTGTAKSLSAANRYRLNLEELETRLAPATYNWSGLGADNKWATGANWQSGIAPTGTAATMDNLVFPSGAAQLNNNNNISNGVFNSITFTGNNYNLTGNKLTLGDPSISNGGYIIVNPNVTGDKISLNIQMGGAGGNQQFFTINAGANLTIGAGGGGKLSGTTGATLTKDGTGTLILSADNSGFTGPIKVGEGVLSITNNKALGDSSGTTSVEANAQLSLNNVTGGSINEPLVLKGSGVASDGALLNAAGINTWSGTVKMDSDVTFGAASVAGIPTEIIISGVLSDLGAGHNLTKEGTGQLTLSASNTYRGKTTINDGIVEIRHGSALGTADDTNATTSDNTGTVVNKTLTKTGMLQINPTGFGLTVAKEQLTLNDAGIGNLGSLYVVSGTTNQWDGNVILESNVTIGANQNAVLAIDGVINDPNGTFSLIKRGQGEIVLTNENTYGGLTTIQQGILTIADSNALGTVTQGTTVSSGATLKLDVGPKVRADTETGDTNRIAVTESLTITGTGFGLLGALYSATGLNYINGTVLMTGASAAIGVDGDPNESSDNSYFPTYNPGPVNAGFPNTGDWSLTVKNISGASTSTFIKENPGHLILPNANNGFNGKVLINEGWVTIMNNRSLGNRQPGVPDNLQPKTTVAGGAALHMKPTAATNGGNADMILDNNLVLSGVGPSHNFNKIDQNGALLNLGGINTLSGNIALDGNVGIGVEQVDANSSELTLTGWISDSTVGFSQNRSATGGSAEDSNIIDTGATNGAVIISWDMFSIPDQLRVYYPERPGGTLLFDTGVVSGSGTATVNYAGSSTLVEIVVNEGGGSSGTAWTYSVDVVANAALGGITKLGSQRLIIQGDGTYSGDVDVAEGVLRAQNDTALGTATDGSMTTTTVEAGAALELAAGLARNNGGIRAGAQIWNEHVILNGSGNPDFGDAPLVNMNGTDAQGNPMAGDNMWRGPVTLNTIGTVYAVTFQNALGLSAQPDMTVDDTNLSTDNGPLTPGSVTVATTTTGSGSQNAVQTITFPQTVTGGTFTLTFNTQTTGPIAWSSNASTLAHNIQLALDKLGNVGLGNTQTASKSAAIDIRQGTRLTLFGDIDDQPNADPNGSDLAVIITGGGTSELALHGANTFRGTTYVNLGLVLIVGHGQALGNSIIGESQTIALGGNTGGTFNVSFNTGPVGPPLNYNATAAQVQATLNALTTIGGGNIGGSVSVTRVADVITVTFGGSLAGFHQPLVVATGLGGTIADVAMVNDGGGGTVVADGAAIELQGNITVAGEPVVIAGKGVAQNPNIPLRWFQQGGAPITDGQTAGNLTVTGRVTGVVVDPKDPDTIYISTADGGAWKTRNGGVTWQPLFDSFSATTPLFSGAIALAPSNSAVIYLGTGEANNSADSYYGTGVYKSTDFGVTWAKVTGLGGVNPLDGMAIAKIVVDPTNANRIYVAVSDRATNNAATGAPGIWRHNGTTWFNMTAQISTTRSGTPGTPGPDDDSSVSFPQSDGTWSDLDISSGPTGTILYAALGSTGGPNTGANAVFRCQNPTTNSPVWFMDAFPFGGANGNIKISAFGNGTLGGTTVYAAVTDRASGAILTLRRSDDGGQDWSNDVTPPNYLGNRGNFASTIVAQTAEIVYIGGSGDNADINADGNADGANAILRTLDSGGTWEDITGVIPPPESGPHPGAHAMAVARDLTGAVVGIKVGTDGGVYSYDTVNASWEDANGNLAITQFGGVAVDPSNPNSAFGASTWNGVNRFIGSQIWEFVDNQIGSPNGYVTTATHVQVDPNNPNNVYAIVSDGVNGFLRKSSTGGALNSWSTVGNFVGPNNMPLLLDSINTNRVLSAGGVNNAAASGVDESLDGGATWASLQGTGALTGVTVIAAAGYQGNYVLDPSFASVADVGANTYVPDTIYVIVQNRVQVTKNKGSNWVTRLNGGALGLTLSDIIVDPSNRDRAWVVSSAAVGTASGRVFRTDDAGQNWTDLTSNLPDIPTWKLVLDPRNGNLYAGTDYGVYRSNDGGGSWARFGQGLPVVQVKDLVLNPALNTISIGTYGRSMYTFWLNDTTANAGVLTSVSGSAVWTGPVILGGAANSEIIVSARGSQSLQNGTAAATLNIVGTISDLTVNGNHKITKKDGGDVILSGANVYSGATVVEDGVLIVRNTSALGGSVKGTTVQFGAALELQSSINNEPLFLNGDGLLFNDHFTGALHNTSNNNTYTGPITLAAADTLRNDYANLNPVPAAGTGVTIGVDTGSKLTITNSISDVHANGNPQNLTLTKEGTGTLTLAQGVSFNVTFQNGLGNSSQSTMTVDGSGLTGTRPSASVATIIPGTASNNAVQTLAFGGNVNGGTFTLTFNSQTTTAISWDADGDTLRANIQAALDAPAMGIGGGNTLVTANMYSGGTFVNQGIVQLAHGQGLGTASSNTTVFDGAQLQLVGTLEVQSVTVTGTKGTFTLTFGTGTNNTTTALAFNASAAAVQTALNNLATIGGVPAGSSGGSVSVTKTGTIYTVTFQGPTLSGMDLPLMSASPAGGLASVVTAPVTDGSGPIVASLSQALHVSGTGIANTGAMQSVNGNNTWSGNVTMESLPLLSVPNESPFTTPPIAVSFSAVNAGDMLTIGGVIDQNGTNSVGTSDFGLTKVGLGKVVLAQGNTYTGTTTVQTGILSVQDNTSLGDSVATPITAEKQFVQVTGSAGTFTLTFNGQTTASLNFNAPASSGAGNVQDALIDLSSIGGIGGSVSVTKAGSTYTVTFLRTLAGFDLPTMTAAAINGATATVNTTGTPVDGVGGTVVSAGATLQLDLDPLTTGTPQTLTKEPVWISGTGSGNKGALHNLSGDNTWSGAPILLNGNSSIGSEAGILHLGADTPGVGVLNGAASTVLTKVGLGTLDLTERQTKLLGSVTVSQGTLLANGPNTGNTIGAVTLTGGTIGGNGTVASITSGLGGGTVNPGSSPGILNVDGPVVWNSSTVFFVELDGLTPGTEYDVLNVNGTINLGGATLSGSVGFVSGLGDQFTIITASGIISGAFASGGKVFISGMKFLIAIDNAGATKTVTLTHVLADSTTTVTSSHNPAPFAENLTFTATVAPEGGTVAPVGVADFIVDGTTVASSVAVVSGIATYQTSTLSIAGSPHSVVVNFTDTDGNFNDSNGTLSPSQTITKANTVTTVLSSSNPSVFGQTVTFTAVISAASPSSGTPAGTVSFVIDSVTVTAGVALSSGQAKYQTSTLSISAIPHSVRVVYANSDGNYNNSSGTLVGGQTVTKANSQVAVSSSTNPSVFGQAVTFTATVSVVSPGTGTPAGTVDFVIDGSTAASNVALSSGVATFQTSTLGVAGSPHSVVINFTDTDGKYNNSSGSLAGGQTVNKADTAVAVSSSNVAPVFGQAVTFTVTVSSVSPGTGTPAGTVDFVIDGTTAATGIALSSGVATFQTSSLNVPASPHTVVAQFVDTDGKYNNSSGTLAGGQSVVKANSALAVSSSTNPSVFGQNVTFTAIASAVSPGSGTPGGTATFILDGTTVASNVALSSGQATFQTSTLSIGGSPHSLTVNFTDTDGNFNNSSGSLSGGQTVTKANSSVAVNSSANPSVFGQNVTFTAVVSAASPGSGTPAGNVDFVIDGSTVASNVALSSGQATFQTSTLSIAGSPHSVVVNFTDTDGNYNNNSGSLAGGQTVNKANTAVAVSSSVNASVFGQNVTFTAVVSAVSPGTGTPAGTVNFVIDGSTAASNVALSSGQATFQTSTLTVSGSPHAIVVSFSDTTGNYNNNSGSLAGGQTVNKANSSVAVSSSNNPSVFGQNVTFTAIVSSVSPGSGTPAGTVDFVIDTTTVASNVALSSGQATFQTSSLNVAGSPHSIVVNFTDTDGSYNNSSGTMAGGQTVNKANSSVAISSSNNPSVFGQNVTFTATVSAVSPGSGTPAGTVNFVIDTTTVASDVALSSGQATFQTSTLSIAGSPHSVVVSFTDTSGNFNNSNGTMAGGQTVTKADSQVAVSSSNNPSVFGQNVTFTATVSAASPGSGTPAGTVNFVIDTTTVASNVALSSGQATFQTSTLSVSGSPHSVVVSFTDTSGNYNNSSGTMAGGQTVNKADSSVAVSSSTNPSVFGQNVTFTATVSAVSPGSGTPAGTVNFVIDSTTLASNVALSSGQATFQTSTLNVAGSVHSVVVSFADTSGNYNNSSGTMAGGQTVNKANTSTTLSTTNANAVYGEATIKATVAAVSPSSGTPTGSVTFHVDNGSVITDLTIGLTSGIATLVPALNVGSYTITADYGTDDNFNASSGALAGGQTVTKANSSLAISSSQNPSVFGQNVTFTATVSAQSPGSGTPAGTVNFVIDTTTVASNVALAGGMATFQTSTLVIAGSPHSVVVSFSDTSGNFNNSSGTMAGGQTVTKANSSVAVASSVNPSDYNQNVTFTASVTAQSPGAGSPAGTVDFVIDGSTAASNVALSSGQATFQISTLSIAGSPHSIVVNFADSSGNFNNGSGSLAGGQTVRRINSTVTVDTSSSSPVYGENVTWTATVAGVVVGPGTPQGTVDFIVDGTTVVTGIVLSSGVGTFQTSALSTPLTVPGSPHAVVASFHDTDLNFNDSSGALAGGQTVTKANTSTTLGTTNANAVFGAATITATVAAVSPGSGTPTGSVTFHVNNGTSTSNFTIGLSSGVATLAPALNVGTYTITADYSNDANFSASSGSLAGGQTVSKASSQVAISSSSNPSVFGQAVTFTATVSAQSPGSGIPSGTVSFVIDGTTVASSVGLSSGKATFQTSTLNVSGSPHTIVANFSDTSGNFINNSGTMAGGQTVNKANSQVAISSTPSGPVFGQNVTITATVSAVSPGTGTPAGTVNFVIDASTLASNVALVSGKATFQTSTLGVTGSPHSVVVSFSDTSGNFNNSSGTMAGGQTINKANSSVAVSSSNIPSVFGQNVTFTGTVSAVSPGSGTPAGTVNFVIDGSTVASNVALVSGKATFQTSTLGVTGSPHSVVVSFSDTSGNFNNSSGTMAGGQTINKANSSVALSSSNNPSVFGQNVTITATISAVSPGTGTPAGTVDFVVDGSTLATGIATVSGQATFQISSLSVAGSPHSVRANFNDTDGNFNNSSGTMAGGQTVSKASSSVAVSSSSAPSVFGQMVTFTATISAVGPGSGTPAGKVNFIVDGTTAAVNVTVVGSQATYQTSILSVAGSPHSVMANFAATDGSFNNSSNSLSGGQTVNPADTSVAVSSSKNPSTFGSTVTFTAIVLATSPGSGTPAGTVNFVIDGTTTVTKTLISGKATYATSSLSETGSPHSADVAYNNSDGKYNDGAGSLAGGQAVLGATKLSASKPKPAVNVPFSITVIARADNGAYVPGYTGTATLTKISGPGKLSGKKSVSFVKGKAVFKDLKVSRPGTYTVKFTTSTGLEITIKFTTVQRWT